MNEQVARQVVLVRAIEMADSGRVILSDDDRLYASRSARELAQWQAADRKTAALPDYFLQHRAEQILKRLGERHPAFAAFAGRRVAVAGFTIALAVAALIVGAGLDRISDPHRVDLLSAPLLAILGWNALVYLALFVWLFIPERAVPAGLLRRFAAARAAPPRKLPPVLASASANFLGEWTALSAPLSRARIARAFHVAAAMFALGAMLSLYGRGLMTQYAAGWESTFLDASQVQRLLAFVLSPATHLFGMAGFSVAEIEALRFTQQQAPVAGARWVHLYAATLLLIAVVPRLLLAAVAHWQARRLASAFPLDLGAPYFRKLNDVAGLGPAGVLRVLPYSFTLDEVRTRQLNGLAHAMLDEQAQLVLRPVSGYGEEAVEALRGTGLDDRSVTLTAALFNLAATPEKENHGAFLDYLRQHCASGLCVLVDESSYRERMAGDTQRLEQRVALWRDFCAFHRAPATIVNLADPALRPLDPAGPALAEGP